MRAVAPFLRTPRRLKVRKKEKTMNCFSHVLFCCRQCLFLLAGAGRLGGQARNRNPEARKATCSAKHRGSFIVFWLAVTVHHALVSSRGCLVVRVIPLWSVAMLHAIARGKHGHLGGAAPTALQCPSLHVDVFLFRRGPMASSTMAVKKGTPVLVFLIAIAPLNPATGALGHLHTLAVHGRLFSGSVIPRRLTLPSPSLPSRYRAAFF